MWPDSMRAILVPDLSNYQRDGRGSTEDDCVPSRSAMLETLWQRQNHHSGGAHRSTFVALHTENAIHWLLATAKEEEQAKRER